MINYKLCFYLTVFISYHHSFNIFKYNYYLGILFTFLKKEIRTMYFVLTIKFLQIYIIEICRYSKQCTPKCNINKDDFKTLLN